MNRLFLSMPISCTLLCHGLQAQLLVVNRGFDPTQAATKPIRLSKPGFLGDHFRIGASGEVWFIDTIRTWTRTDESSGLADVFESISLFGGIEASPPPAGQPPQPDCDCHNLMTIKTGIVPAGNDQSTNGDVAWTRVSPGLFQIEFRNLHWSVPGGTDLQFGVKGTGRGRRQPWTDQVAATPEAHALKTFDDKGKLEGPYAIDDPKIGLNVQVWGHKSASMAIRSASTIVEVELRSEGKFDAAKTDASTLHFGPRNAAPIATRLDTVDSKSKLIARFRRADLGIADGVVSVCLTGLQQDGVPFEGCDLISRK